MSHHAVARTAVAGPAPALGVQFHCTWRFYTDEDRAAALEKLQSAGIKWVRIDIGWASLQESGRGALTPWYVDVTDRCVNMALARGMKVLGLLHMTPGWANGDHGTNTPPRNVADFRWIAHWAALHFRGRVAAWEIWNEPNLQAFWLGSTPDYVRLLKAATPAIRLADPAALVVLGGPSSNDDKWLRAVYELGAKSYFDVVATHPYQGVGDAPPDRADDGNRWWFTHLPAVRKTMIDFGDSDKPIWFTEFGWSAHKDVGATPNWARGVTPSQQAAYLVRAVRYTRSSYPYVTLMFWYKERANPSGTDSNIEGYALLNADLSERPVYLALKALIHG